MPPFQDVDRVGNGMIAKKLESTDLIAADSADENAIRARVGEIRPGSQSMRDFIVGYLLEDKQILKHGQRERFFEALKARIRARGAPGPLWLAVAGD